MPKISEACVREIRTALEQYRAELQPSDLRPRTIGTHYSGANVFVNWLAEDYAPGDGLNRRRRSCLWGCAGWQERSAIRRASLRTWRRAT